MSNIPKNRVVVSYVDEKYRDRISESLSAYSDINIVKIAFTKLEDVIDVDSFCADTAYYLINALCENEFTIFIVGLSRPFDLLIIEAIIDWKRESDNTMLFIVTCMDDMMKCDRDNRERYCAMINGADKVMMTD